MRYVLDSNVGLKWLLPEADSDKALLIRDDYRRQVHDLIAPDVFPVEVAHSLTRAERQGRITPAEGRSHFGDMIATLPMLHPYLPLLPRAYELSSQRASVCMIASMSSWPSERDASCSPRTIGSSEAFPGIGLCSSHQCHECLSQAGTDPLGSLSRQAGAMVRPFGAMVNTVVPPSAAPEGPATPPGGPATTVIWPPVGNVWLPASVRVTASVPGL